MKPKKDKCYCCKEKLPKRYRTILVYDTIKNDLKELGDFGFCQWEVNICGKCWIIINSEKDGGIAIGLYKK